jgi:hypothetical protein
MPRYLFNLIVGGLLQLYMFRETTYHIYLMAGVAYIIMNIFARDF